MSCTAVLAGPSARFEQHTGRNTHLPDIMKWTGWWIKRIYSASTEWAERKDPVAYLILYPHARVITLIPIVIFPYIVEIPAFLYLGIWFLSQLMSGAAGSKTLRQPVVMKSIRRGDPTNPRYSCASRSSDLA